MAKHFYQKVIAVLIVCAGILFVFNISVGFAQTSSEPQTGPSAQQTPLIPQPVATPLPEISTYTDSLHVTLKEMDIPSFTMELPSSYSLPIDLPNQWAITSDQSITHFELHYDFYYDLQTPKGEVATDSSVYSVYPVVSVYVDEVLAKTFTPSAGINQTETIPFPFEALRDLSTFYTSNYHEINLVFQEHSYTFCTGIGQLIVHDDSFLDFGFLWKPAAIDLGNFPDPLLMGSFLPETIPVILPDEYGEADLEAAITIIKRVANLTTSNVKFNVITASEATQNLLKNSSAIAIGTPDKNEFIRQLYVKGFLPTTLRSDGTIVRHIKEGESEDIAAENGVVQMVPSEYNDLFTYLVISSSSEEGVSVAAKGLANLPPIGFSGNLAVIKPGQVAGVTQVTTAADENDIITFQSLGLNDIQFYGKGAYSSNVSFYVPIDWNVTDQARLALIYEYSTKLSVVNSNMTVRLNDRPIATIPVEDLAPGKKQISIPLDPSFFVRGQINYISFDVVLSMELECANWDPRNYWINIRNTSALYLPHTMITDQTLLSNYMHPFSHLAYTDKILILLPPEHTMSDVNGLINLIYRISTLQRVQRATDFQVSFTQDFTVGGYQEYQDYHIVAIGMPSENQFIRESNDLLPLPFLPGGDTLMQQAGDAVFKLSDDISLGVIEVLGSPLNPNRCVTVITGTSSEGVQWAVNAIGNRSLPYNWVGDIFLIRDNIVDSYTSTITDIKSLQEIVGGVLQQDVSLEFVEATVTPVVVATAEAVDDFRYISSTGDASSTQQMSTRTIILISIVAIVGLALLIIAGIRLSRGGRRL